MIDRMGDKASAKAMIEAGVPVVPGSVGESFEQAQELARSFGYSNA
jgi:biotin carboxylase